MIGWRCSLHEINRLFHALCPDIHVPIHRVKDLYINNTPLICPHHSCVWDSGSHLYYLSHLCTLPERKSVRMSPIYSSGYYDRALRSSSRCHGGYSPLFCVWWAHTAYDVRVLCLRHAHVRPDHAHSYAIDLYHWMRLCRSAVSTDNTAMKHNSNSKPALVIV